MISWIFYKMAGKGYSYLVSRLITYFQVERTYAYSFNRG